MAGRSGYEQVARTSKNSVPFSLVKKIRHVLLTSPQGYGILCKLLLEIITPS